MKISNTKHNIEASQVNFKHVSAAVGQSEVVLIDRLMRSVSQLAAL